MRAAAPSPAPAPQQPPGIPRPPPAAIPRRPSAPSSPRHAALKCAEGAGGLSAERGAGRGPGREGRGPRGGARAGGGMAVKRQKAKVHVLDERPMASILEPEPAAAHVADSKGARRRPAAPGGVHGVKLLFPSRAAPAQQLPGRPPRGLETLQTDSLPGSAARANCCSWVPGAGWLERYPGHLRYVLFPKWRGC